jgi:hypothetical protein
MSVKNGRVCVCGHYLNVHRRLRQCGIPRCRCNRYVEVRVGVRPYVQRFDKDLYPLARITPSEQVNLPSKKKRYDSI